MIFIFRMPILSVTYISLLNIYSVWWILQTYIIVQLHFLKKIFDNIVVIAIKWNKK